MSSGWLHLRLGLGLQGWVGLFGGLGLGWLGAAPLLLQQASAVLLWRPRTTLPFCCPVVGDPHSQVTSGFTPARTLRLSSPSHLPAGALP